MNEQNNLKIKKKKYWLIPLLLFVGGFLTKILSITIMIYLKMMNENSDMVVTEPLIVKILNIIYIILIFLVVPSIIYVVIKQHDQKN